MDLLIDIHSWLRWLVLAVAVAVPVVAYTRYRSGTAWVAGSDRPFALAAVVVDLQVALGIVIWIGERSWSGSAFFAFVHPLAMLAALAAIHVGVGRARREASTRSYLVVAVAFLVGLVLVVAGVPWFR
jgi:hypothetical protein